MSTNDTSVIEILIKHLDEDGSGQIEFNEFLEFGIALEAFTESMADKEEMKAALLDGNDSFPPFTLDELKKEVKLLKPNKAAGIDGILNEFLKHLGPKAQQWVLSLFNSCVRTKKTPRKHQENIKK